MTDHEKKPDINLNSIDITKCGGGKPILLGVATPSKDEQALQFLPDSRFAVDLFSKSNSRGIETLSTRVSSAIAIWLNTLTEPLLQTGAIRVRLDYIQPSNTLNVYVKGLPELTKAQENALKDHLIARAILPVGRCKAERDYQENEKHAQQVRKSKMDEPPSLN